jgi:cardiolipin synthase
MTIAHLRQPLRMARPPSLSALAEQAFSRAAGAPLVEGNDVRLLEDARENYPAWLEAIGGARHHVHFESYIIHDDATGAAFAEALVAKAREGVKVRLLYDWLGAIGKSSRTLWQRLRDGGVEVRCYNPPRLTAPLGWLSRDHRKMLAVDGRIAFVSGLCVGRMWVGDPEDRVEPWRDTGVMVRGPAVADIERAFAEVWATEGEPIPADELPDARDIARAGAAALRVIATSPATGGMFRVDQLVAALAQRRLWLADAYYAGTPSHVQALCAAAKDGVDVRLLGPNASDIPILKPLSRAGHRTLLEAGVRVFEWNGPMMHAKTAVADGRWARVGSTNLNVASWFGNYELDIVVEDEGFAREMEAAYLRDLERSTELFLDRDHRARAGTPPPSPAPARARAPGSAGRAAAGVIRVGNAMGAAFTAHGRVLEPFDGRLAGVAGLVALVLAALFVFFPRLLAYPVAFVLAWIALALVLKSYRSSR